MGDCEAGDGVPWNTHAVTRVPTQDKGKFGAGEDAPERRVLGADQSGTFRFEIVRYRMQRLSGRQLDIGVPAQCVADAPSCSIDRIVCVTPASTNMQAASVTDSDDDHAESLGPVR